MKRVKGLVLGVAGVIAAVAASGAMAAPLPNGITGSKHDLTVSTTAGNNHVTDGTAEICVFCHTPHGSDTDASVPLWNRRLQTDIYTTYDNLKTATLDGTILTPGSVSVACLSCHDGTQSMDSLINLPGSGGYSLSAPDQNWTWSGTRVTAAGIIDSAQVTNLGTDLQDDHPVGVQYAGGGVSATTPTPAASAFADEDFALVSHTQINGKDMWWVETQGDTKRTRSDLLLYTRQEAGKGVVEDQPFVECASCHDPHVQAADANQVAFLRISNAASALCLACHNK